MIKTKYKCNCNCNCKDEEPSPDGYIEVCYKEHPIDGTTHNGYTRWYFSEIDTWVDIFNGVPLLYLKIRIDKQQTHCIPYSNILSFNIKKNSDEYYAKLEAWKYAQKVKQNG